MLKPWDDRAIKALDTFIGSTLLFILFTYFLSKPISPDLSDSFRFAQNGWYGIHEITYYSTLNLLAPIISERNFTPIILSVIFFLELRRDKASWIFIALLLYDPLWTIGAWQFVQITLAVLLFKSRWLMFKILGITTHAVLLLVFSFRALSVKGVRLLITGIIAMILSLLFREYLVELYSLFLDKFNLTIDKGETFDLPPSIYLRIFIFCFVYVVQLSGTTRSKLNVTLLMLLLLFFSFEASLISFRIIHFLWLWTILVNNDILIRKALLYSSLPFAIINMIRLWI